MCDRLHQRITVPVDDRAHRFAGRVLDASAAAAAGHADPARITAHAPAGPCVRPSARRCFAAAATHRVRDATEDREGTAAAARGRRAAQAIDGARGDSERRARSEPVTATPPDRVGATGVQPPIARAHARSDRGSTRALALPPMRPVPAADERHEYGHRREGRSRSHRGSPSGSVHIAEGPRAPTPFAGNTHPLFVAVLLFGDVADRLRLHGPLGKARGASALAREPTIHWQDDPRHVFRLIRGEEQRRVGHVPGRMIE